MKKIKFLACLFVGLIACLGFTACSDDNDDDEYIPEIPNEILGTWVNTIFDEDEGEYVKSFTFLKEGTGIVAREYPDSPKDNFKLPFKWKFGGDISKNAILTLEGKDGAGYYYTEIYHVQIVGEVLFLTDNEGRITSWDKKE